MEKLIELLNEYEIKDYHIVHHKIKDGKVYRSIGNLNEWTPIWWYSKSFGFIKWLVENDKIDIEKVIDTAKSSVIDTYYYEEGIDDIYIPLLMVLAIQDEPIEYLLSVIK